MPTIETAIEVWITRDADGTLGLDIDESPSGAPIICGFADDMQDYVQINDVITALHGHEINSIADLVNVLRMPDVAEANKLQLRISRAEKVQQAPAKRRRSLVPSEDTKPGALLQPDAMLVHSLSLPSVLKRLWRPALLVSALIVLILLRSEKPPSPQTSTLATPFRKPSNGGAKNGKSRCSRAHSAALGGKLPVSSRCCGR